MYKITLMDENRSPIADDVAVFFTEDIDDFIANWLFTGRVDAERHDRLKRSKEGQIVTDYYSTDPSLNIVQKDETNILYKKEFTLRDVSFFATNAYGFQGSYHVDTLEIEFIWLRFKNEYWRTASFKAIGASEFSTILQEYTSIICFGNPVLINTVSFSPQPYRLGSNENKNRKEPTLEDFKNNVVESFCYTASVSFDGLETLKKDYENFNVTPEILDYLFSDVIGEAG
jgi:hypothetical protein